MGDLQYKLQDLKDKLKVDSLRDWVNNNSAAVTVGAVVVLIISLGVIISNSGGRSTNIAPGEAWYYDTVTKEYFTGEATHIPPIDHNGNEAVRAHFFTCGQCTEEARFIGYFEKYTAEAKSKIESNPEAMEMYYEVEFQGRLFSETGEPDTWVEAESPEGRMITQKLHTKCPPKKLRYCPPKR